MNNYERSLATKNVDVKTLAKVSILGAISFIIMNFDFPLPFFVPFLKMDFSDVPPMLGAFALGPWAGVGIQLVKNIIHAFKSQTAFVGELANFISGSMFVLPAAFIYYKKKDIKGAIIGMTVGIILSSITMSMMNYFVLIPVYSKLLNIPLDVIVNMGTAINSSITDLKSLVMFSVFPFNLFKGTIVSLVTFMLYKRLAPILRK